MKSKYKNIEAKITYPKPQINTIEDNKITNGFAKIKKFGN
jgi:hypothetical protein